MDNNYITELPNQLKTKDIYIRLNEVNLKIQSKKIYEFLEDNYSKIFFYYDLLENNKEYCRLNLSFNNFINPILWQLGHINLFYIRYVLDLLKNDYKNEKTIIKNLLESSFKINDIHYMDYYDSFITNLFIRYKYVNLIDIKKLKKCYKNIVAYIKTYIKIKSNNFKKNLDIIDNYLIMLGILHNDMHYEALLFSSNFFGFIKPKNIKFYDEYYYSKTYNKSLYFCNNFINKWINIKGGSFTQGHKYSIENTEIHFDNEQPSFYKEIDDFTVSKYPITEGEYLLFMNSNGYNNKKYWCINGWDFIKSNNIISPLYWVSIKDKKNKKKWVINDWCGKRNIATYTKKPVRNVSWYEAKAYCKWRGLRLLKESEWEYLSTNKGTTKYPWGDSEPNYLRCNIDYKNSNVMDVDYFETINVFSNKTNDRFDSLNMDYVSQLIGNIWEWCEESIYPYDGFQIDPVYREMSYPCFGIKKICRGGCWASSSYLINSKYRNAQEPTCRIQWIGFRVCKI